MRIDRDYRKATSRVDNGSHISKRRDQDCGQDDRYTKHGVIDEYWACRENAVVIDLSALRKYEVTGPDAELLLQTCVTRDIRRLTPGQVVYTAMCYENGGMIDDGTVFRLGQDNFRWVGGSDESGIWLREQATKLGLQAWVRNSTSQLLCPTSPNV